jgi:hypothetical protein
MRLHAVGAMAEQCGVCKPSYESECLTARGGPRKKVTGYPISNIISINTMKSTNTTI